MGSPVGKRQSCPSTPGSQKQSGGVKRGRGEARSSKLAQIRFREAVCATQPTSGAIPCRLPDGALICASRNLALAASVRAAAQRGEGKCLHQLRAMEGHPAASAVDRPPCGWCRGQATPRPVPWTGICCCSRARPPRPIADLGQTRLILPRLASASVVSWPLSGAGWLGWWLAGCKSG